jgi:hypothetical protein
MTVSFVPAPQARSARSAHRRVFGGKSSAQAGRQACEQRVGQRLAPESGLVGIVDDSTGSPPGLGRWGEPMLLALPLSDAGVSFRAGAEALPAEGDPAAPGSVRFPVPGSREVELLPSRPLRPEAAPASCEPTRPPVMPVPGASPVVVGAAGSVPIEGR